MKMDTSDLERLRDLKNSVELYQAKGEHAMAEFNLLLTEALHVLGAGPRTHKVCLYCGEVFRATESCDCGMSKEAP